jgi:hypothetical protein
LAYRTGNADWTTIEVENAKTVQLTGLAPLSAYEVRIRTICTDDVSSWTNASFSTTEITCLVPTNLQATGITEKSATLSWEADEENLTWDLHYREGVATSWTTVNAWEEKSYLLNNLKSNTAYLWSVRGVCEENRTSSWANQEEFRTDIADGINTIGHSSWKVFAAGKIINILNPEHRMIDHVQLFDITGSMIIDFTINSNENVLIPAALTQPVVIVKIFSNGISTASKLIIK